MKLLLRELQTHLKEQEELVNTREEGVELVEEEEVQVGLKELHLRQEDLILPLLELEDLEVDRILELMLVMVLLEELILAMVHQELEDLLLVDILAEGEMLGTWNCLPLKILLYLKKS